MLAEEQRKVEGLLHEVEIFSWSLHDLRSADVPVQHTFEVTDDKPFYHRPRRMSPKHKQIIVEEVQKILDTGVIVLATSA